MELKKRHFTGTVIFCNVTKAKKGGAAEGSEATTYPLCPDIYLSGDIPLKYVVLSAAPLTILCPNMTYV